MGRQYRSARSGEGRPSYAVAKASSTDVTVPTGGLVVLSTAVGADFTLAPPEAGVRTFIAATLVTTGGIILRACTKGATSVSFSSTAGDRVLKWDKAGTQVVSLLGISTAEWNVTGITPASTVVITGTT